MKGNYDYQKKKVFIRNCNIENNINKFSYYPLFNQIDYISKKTILREIDTKNKIILLGEKKVKNEKKCSNEYNIDKKYDNCNIVNNIINNENKIVYLTSRINPHVINGQKENEYLISNKEYPIKNTNQFYINTDNPILDIKFDSSILQKMTYVEVKDLGKVYELKDYFLKIKTKRDKPDLDEITLIAHDEIKLNEKRNMNIFLYDENSNENNDNDLDYIYNKVQLKLLDLKKEIVKNLNEDVMIYGDYISNKNKEFKLYLRNEEIVLEGYYNATYMKIRKFVKSYIRTDI